jgi:hypothetical protein
MNLENAVHHGAHGEHGERSIVCAEDWIRLAGDQGNSGNILSLRRVAVFAVVQMRFLG